MFQIDLYMWLELLTYQKSTGWYMFEILEAYIKKTSRNCNRDSGYNISEMYHPVLFWKENNFSHIFVCIEIIPKPVHFMFHYFYSLPDITSTYIVSNRHMYIYCLVFIYRLILCVYKHLFFKIYF